MPCKISMSPCPIGTSAVSCTASYLQFTYFGIRFPPSNSAVRRRRLACGVCINFCLSSASCGCGFCFKETRVCNHQAANGIAHTTPSSVRCCEQSRLNSNTVTNKRPSSSLQCGGENLERSPCRQPLCIVRQLAVLLGMPLPPYPNPPVAPTPLVLSACLLKLLEKKETNRGSVLRLCSVAEAVAKGRNRHRGELERLCARIVTISDLVLEQRTRSSCGKAARNI